MRAGVPVLVIERPAWTQIEGEGSPKWTLLGRER